MSYSPWPLIGEVPSCEATTYKRTSEKSAFTKSPNVKVVEVRTKTVAFLIRSQAARAGQGKGHCSGVWRNIGQVKGLHLQSLRRNGSGLDEGDPFFSSRALLRVDRCESAEHWQLRWDCGVLRNHACGFYVRGLAGGRVWECAS